MKTIGLTGGIASGKSAVAAALARRGAVVFDADRMGHDVLQEPEVRDELVTRWGRDIVDAAGRVDRAAVAARVFGDSPQAAQDRQFLELLVHPRIRQRMEAEIRRLPDDAVPAVVIDAPLLMETGWNAVCQLTLFVDAPQPARLERALGRGWTAEEFARREAAQMPIREKRRRSTHVLANAGDLADLEREVDQFWRDHVE